MVDEVLDQDQGIRKKNYEAIETGYHAVRWHEPVIYELSRRGFRGDMVPQVEDPIQVMVGDVTSRIPEKMRRQEAPDLPEISEPEVMRHYLRLSQQTYGYDSGVNLGVGTCTMKYSPKVNDQLAALPYLRYAHPLQPEATIQGILKILYELRSWFCEISGMDEFSFQPRGGSHGVHANARIIQAYHQANGDMTRDEMITCAVSHPCNAGCPSSIGYKIIELYPEKDTGDIGLEKFKSVVSDRTAGLMITAPYDTGVFDSQLSKYIDLVHEAGGLVALDQANYNGVMTRLRAGDVGADLMHFNLHKTFSTPHGSFGPGSGAIGAKEHLRSFMPVPIVEFNGQDYHLNYNLTQSIGSIGSFYGVVMNAVRAYAWIMSMGAQGLREASDWAVINNNYLIKKLLEVRGLEISWPNRRKLQEARFSLQKLKEETGIGTNEFNRRIADYGIQTYVTSHYPVIIPEPVTPEPSESTSREDIDHFVDIFHRISDEAYSNPEIIKTAPHRCSIHQMDEEVFQDIDQATVTWQAYAKKKGLA